MAFHERRIDVGRVTLRIREAGDGPLVVFLHGITANAAIWDPVLARLRGSFRVVAVDQRGHGESDKPRAGYRDVDFGEDVLNLVASLGGEPSVLVGHSLGARNAIVAASMRPEAIRGVVAVDFTPFIDTEIFDALEKRVRGGDRLFESFDEVTAYLRERYPRLPKDAVIRRAVHGFRETNGRYRPSADPRAMVQTVDGLREDLEPAVRAMRCPTLLIRGADSTLVTSAAFTKTLQVRPDFAQLVVDGVDHYVVEEAPSTVSDAILAFAAPGPR